MTPTSVIYLVKNIKMHKKHLMKLKIINKLKNKQNKSLLNNNKKGKRSLHLNNTKYQNLDNNSQMLFMIP